MTEWTAERLDALPEGAVIEFDDVEIDMPTRTAHKARAVWHVSYSSSVYFSAGIIDRAALDSIRVVSVPVEALLAISEQFGMTYYGEDFISLRAALAHVTGEDTDLGCWECQGTGMATLNPDEEPGSHTCRTGAAQ